MLSSKMINRLYINLNDYSLKDIKYYAERSLFCKRKDITASNGTVFATWENSGSFYCASKRIDKIQSIIDKANERG